MSPEERVVAARLEPVEAEIGVGDRFTYSIVNTGNVPLSYGSGCDVQWRPEGHWLSLPLGGWVVASAKGIDPGERSDTETYDLAQHLAPGRYRLVIRLSSIDVLPSTDSIEVSCEFSVDLMASFRDEEPE